MTTAPPTPLVEPSPPPGRAGSAAAAGPDGRDGGIGQKTDTQLPRLATRCIHGTGPSPEATGAISTPIYQTATFAHPAVGQSTGFDYTRTANPTRSAFESVMASLESGAEAFAFATGMAAVATVLELFKPGDHIVVSADIYGGTYRLFEQVSQKNGVRFSRAADDAQLAAAVRRAATGQGSADAASAAADAASAAADAAQVPARPLPTPSDQPGHGVWRRVRPVGQDAADAAPAGVAAVFVETPSNPMIQVFDIAAAARAAHAAGALLIVDNTFLTPYFQRPLELGADIVLHSASKYLAGHNDTLAGVAVVADPQLAERIGTLRCTIGGTLAPFDSWLCLRGLKTLAVRLERHAASAFALAHWLREHPAVTEVRYPGFEDHPGFAASGRQASGHGGMIAFKVSDPATARRVLSSVRIIQFAESLGGTESLLTYPVTQTHADVPEAQRRALGIDDCLLRLSVGLEDVDDLRADLAAALGG